MNPTLCRHDWLPVQDDATPTGWTMRYICRHCEALHDVHHDHDARGETLGRVVDALLACAAETAEAA